MAVSTIGLVGLAVMGQVRGGDAQRGNRQERSVFSPLSPLPLHARQHKQNLSLNVAEKGFTISVYNRSYDKTEAAVARAKKEGEFFLVRRRRRRRRCLPCISPSIPAASHTHTTITQHPTRIKAWATS